MLLKKPSQVYSERKKSFGSAMHHKTYGFVPMGLQLPGKSEKFWISFLLIELSVAVVLCDGHYKCKKKKKHEQLKLTQIINCIDYIITRLGFCGPYTMLSRN